MEREAEAGELAPGAVFGAYRVEGVLGRGGMGVVYRAQEVALARQVALKVVAPRLLEDEWARIQFVREAQFAASLEHPNVVPIYATGAHGGTAFLAMRYVVGHDLQTEVRRRGPLEPSRAVALVGQVAAALDAAHGAGLVHRDVKPANVLVSATGHVYLTDFGIAQHTRQQGAAEPTAGRLSGTVGYIAPEVIAGAAADARSDIYALGCMLFFALAGKPPFAGADRDAVLEAHLSAPRPLVSEACTSVPAALDPVVERALARDPGDRYASAGELAAAARIAAADVPGWDVETLSADAPAGRSRAAGSATPAAAEFAVPSPPLLARRHHAPLVGRDDELARLAALSERARGGERVLALVTGEAGMGKTRVALEIARRAHADGAAVLVGRCTEEVLAPFQPFAEALRHLLSAVPAARLAPAALARELGRLVPELVTAPDGEVDRLRLFEAVDAALVAAAGDRGLVLVLDDVHWADASVALLVAHLVRTLRPAPLLILAAYRDTEVGRGHPMAAAIADLRRECVVERVALGPLPSAAVTAMVAAMGADALEAGVAKRAAGNPFFVEALVESHAEGGGEAVPEGVREVIARRVDRLSGPTREALARAAVVGREFEVRVLDALGDPDGDALVTALDEAIAAGLVREDTAPGRLAFGHVLVRDAIYGDLSAIRRARLHARVADALPPSPAAAVAYHVLAGDPARAPVALARAAREALAALAYEEAAAHAEKALEVLGEDEPELLMLAGEAYMRAGRRDPARAAYARADAASHEPALRARAALGFGGLGVTIARTDREVAQRLERSLDGLEDDALRARVVARLAIERYYEPGDVRDQLSAEALQIARRSGDAGALLDALNARHVACWVPDGLDERLALAREMIATARAAGRGESELQGLNWLVTDLYETIDRPALEAAMAEHQRLAEALRLPAYQWYAPLWRSTLAHWDARWEEAAEHRAEAARIGAPTADPNVELFTLIHEWNESLLAARWDELSGDAYEHELAVSSPATIAYKCSYAWFLTETGRPDEARRLVDALAAGEFAAMPRDANWIGACCEFSEACAILGDARGAAVAHDALSPYAGRHAAQMRAVTGYGVTDYHLGRSAATMGHLDAAEAHLERAVDLHERLGAMPWGARSRIALADVREARGHDVFEERRIATALAERADLNTPRLVCWGRPMAP